MSDLCKNETGCMQHSNILLRDRYFTPTAYIYPAEQEHAVLIKVHANTARNYNLWRMCNAFVWNLNRYCSCQNIFAVVFQQ